MMADPIAGAEELRRIIDDPDLRRRKGKEGEEIAKRYDVDLVGRRLEEIYWRILDKPSAHQL
jgi:glycosyltransferase involved in cell wall biosynthesis